MDFRCRKRVVYGSHRRGTASITMPGDARDIAACGGIAKQSVGVAGIVPIVIIRDDLGRETRTIESWLEVVFDEVVLVGGRQDHPRIIRGREERLILRSNRRDGDPLPLVRLDEFDKVLRQWPKIRGDQGAR